MSLKKTCDRCYNVMKRVPGYFVIKMHGVEGSFHVSAYVCQKCGLTQFFKDKGVNEDV